jgi:hypothetical protein
MGRDEAQEEGVACYQTFIRGLLDITDNRVGDRVVRPAHTVCKDDEDPYLVVAADKGTATFSDIANALSQDYGFWLGDAFASGGSVGYDHKKMGITARGAWVSVERHFREIGINPTTDFTVVGIGDMSGDVFGNGMLLSRHIRLVAAFNHQHIFIDPEPDAARSFAERQRLFALPRSGWADYDSQPDFEGGGVFSRAAKSIDIAADAERFGIVSAADAQRTDQRAPARRGRPAVERRYRHLRQIQPRATPMSATRPTTPARERQRAALQGDRRGRQPRHDPARPGGVRLPAVASTRTSSTTPAAWTARTTRSTSRSSSMPSSIAAT